MTGGSGDPLNRAGADLRATADEVTSRAGEAASQVREAAAGAYADVKAEAAGVIGEARERAESFAEQQKRAGAEQAEGLARAVHRAADELQESAPQLAQYVREAAASVSHLAHGMRDRSLGSLMGEVEGLARRQPVAFFGAAVLAGFALSRFLKSSAPEGQPEVRTSGGALSFGEAVTPGRVRVYPPVAAPGHAGGAAPGGATAAGGQAGPISG